MNAATLEQIKQECEKIEKEPGYGKVLISIEGGFVRFIQPSPMIKIKEGLTTCQKK